VAVFPGKTRVRERANVGSELDELASLEDDYVVGTTSLS
jgi:hypothetical protein